MANNITLTDGGSLVFQEAASNGDYTLTLRVGNLTDNRTITLPDANSLVPTINIDGSNLPGGQGVFSSLGGSTLYFKSMAAGLGLTVSGNTNNVTYALSNSGVTSGTYAYPASLVVDATGRITSITGGSAPGSINTASNLGSTGEGVYANKSGDTLNFKKIKAGTGVTLSSDSDSITINASNTAAGTVTSITAGTGLAGGTITTSGTISLATVGTITPGNYSNANVTVDSTGRVIGISSGSGGGFTDPLTTNGDMIVRSGGVTTRLPVGTNGYVLTVSGGQPTWAAASSGFADPTTTTGDLIYRSSGGTTRLGIGTNGYVLKVVGGVPAWAAESGGGSATVTLTGDVTGSGTGTVATTLANSGVTAGTYPKVTVNAKGLVTGGSTLSNTDVPALSSPSTGYLYYNGTSFVYQTPASGGMTNVLTTTGDMIYSSSGSTPARLGIGSNGTFMKSNGTSPSWTALTSSDIPNLDWSKITSGKPTTLSGYGITDAQPLDADLTAIAGLVGTSGLLKKTAADTWTLDTTSYLTANQNITISGDASGSGSTGIALTLSATGVTAGTYSKVTVDAKGRVTSATNIGNSDVPALSSASSGVLRYNGTSFSWAPIADSDVPALSSPTTNKYLYWNGTSFTWNTPSAGVTSVTAGAGLSGGTITSTGTISLPTTGVTANSYTYPSSVTVDAYGRITAISNGSVLSNPMSASGDMIIGGTSGTPTRLAPGTNGQFLRAGTVSGTTPAWQNITYNDISPGNITGTLKGYAEYKTTVSANGSTTLDSSTSNVFVVTLTGDSVISFSGTNNVTVYLYNDTTAGRSLTWGSAVLWAGGTVPTRTTAANALDVWNFTTIDGGVTWIGTLALKDVK